jgi:hypothetical protein
MNNNNKIEKMVFIYKLKKSNVFKKLYLDNLEEDILLYLNDSEDFIDYDDESLYLIKNILNDLLTYIKNK